MKYELSMMSPEKELMKFNCPTLKEAQELAKVMQKEGFTFVQIQRK